MVGDRAVAAAVPNTLGAGRRTKPARSRPRRSTYLGRGSRCRQPPERATAGLSTSLFSSACRQGGSCPRRNQEGPSPGRTRGGFRGGQWPAAPEGPSDVSTFRHSAAPGGDPTGGGPLDLSFLTGES